MQRLLLLGCLLLALNPFCLFAQTKGITPTVPSPNASSLGIFGEIPVSYFTGTPNINIPLYKLDAKLPVQLDLGYHAGGVRPETHPSWVGLGWNLSAGGAITRVMNKLPDELNLSNVGPEAVQAGFYFNHNEINNTGWSGTSYLSAYPTWKDVEPDHFLFNVFGLSGKFFMDETGAWRVQSDRALKVEFDGVFYHPFIRNTGYGAYEWITPTFHQFTIIDENGTRYIFGGDENAIEYTDAMTPLPGRVAEEFFATTWNLSRIVSADGIDVINYTYERGPFVSSLGVSTTLSMITGNPNGHMDPGCSSWNGSIHHYGKLISPVYLKYITYPRKDLRIAFEFSKSTELSYSETDYAQVEYDAYGGSGVDFLHIMQYTSGIIPYYQQHGIEYPAYKNLIWLKLDKVNIENSTGTRVLRSTWFNYNNVATERLELQSLQMKDENNAQRQAWSFTYNPQQLPNYLATMTDHWGFNNNISSSANLNNYYLLRAPNDYYAKARILEKITYPTGGHTKFEYELNNYSAYVSRDRQSIVPEDGTAGGLRIKKITNEDGVSPAQVMEYFYVKNYDVGDNPATLPSSGILDVKPQYSFDNLNGVDIGGASFSYSLFTSSSVIPLTLNSTGTHIGYSEVIEKRADNSYSRYTFTNHNATYTDLPAVNSFNSTYIQYLPFTSHDFCRGRPKEVVHYDNTNNPKYHKIYNYTFVGSTGIKRGKSVHWSVFNVCSGVTASRQAVIKSAYYNPWYTLLPETEEDRVYGSNGTYIATTKSYEYESEYKQVRKISSTNSRNKLEESVFTYPFDLTAATVYNNMKNANIVTPRVEVVNYVNGVADKKVITNWQQWTASLFMPVNEQTQYGSNTPITTRQYDGYDADGNLMSYRDKENIVRTLLWDNKHQLIADVKNAARGQAMVQNFEVPGAWDNYLTAYDNTRSHTGRFSGRIDKPGSGEQVAMSNNWLNVSLTGVTRFRYSGWVYSTGPSAEIFLFMKRATETGYFSYVDAVATNVTNQWVLVEKEFDVPVDVTQLNIRIDNNGGGTVWFDDIRLHPASAQMTTFTYDPLVGNTSKTDMNNQSIYYEYDDFSRLHIIRDNNLNIIKQICYNYAGQPENCLKVYGNDAMSQEFTRNNCTSDEVPQKDFYSLKQGIYVSFKSKEEANQMALNDINAKGQNYINNTVACVPILYARLHHTDPQYVVLDSDGTTMFEEGRADLYIRFFSDAACTQPAIISPLTLFVNLDPAALTEGGAGEPVMEITADGNEALVVQGVAVRRQTVVWNASGGYWQVTNIQVFNHSIQPNQYIRIVP